MPLWYRNSVAKSSQSVASTSGGSLASDMAISNHRSRLRSCVKVVRRWSTLSTIGPLGYIMGVWPCCPFTCVQRRASIAKRFPYEILQYTVNWECPVGRPHVCDAMIDVRHPGSPIRRLSIAELLAIMGDDATFYMEVPDQSGGCPNYPDATLAPYECGHG